METRGAQMLALRKARLAASPPILRGGFRPFFLGGAVWAVVALLLWLAAFLGGLQLPTAFDPLAWHRHEMLFGFVGAIVVGFLMTAIPNWTGRLPIAGWPLAGLFSLWLAGRTALLFSANLGLLVALIIDVAFYLIVALVAAREVFAAKNRNLPLVGLIALFGFANALDYVGQWGAIDPEAASRAGIGLVVMMISLIGGRIIPSFTRNWMTKSGLKESLPGQPAGFDKATLAATGAALLLWLIFPGARESGIVLAAAALLQAVRLARWKGLKTLREPVVAILHIGYAWVPIGLLLLAVSIMSDAIPRTAALHALAAGAMATMILAVMTRATLGHTGREIRAGTGTIAVYALITVGAVLRVTASLGLVDYRLGLEIAGACWIGAFLFFIVIYGPILAGPRTDGRPL